MGKYLALIAVLGSAYGVYRLSFYKSPAYQAYLQWAKAADAGDCATLQGMSESAAKKWADGFCSPEDSILVFGNTISGKSRAEILKDMNATKISFDPPRHELQSENQADDGTVSLVVNESLSTRPSDFNKTPAPRRHDVMLKEINGAWKLMDFRESDLPAR